MPDLPAELAEYCKNVIRRPCKATELIQELMHDASINAAWPTATWAQWERALEMAIVRKLLNRESQTIWIPVVVEEVKPVQMDLF